MDLYSQEIQEKQKDLQNQPQTIKKMAKGTYVSIITLNVNGLNAPTKRHIGAEHASVVIALGKSGELAVEQGI